MKPFAKQYALQLIFIAALAVPDYADDTATTRPASAVSPVASVLQSQVMDVAPQCVANTVGLVVKEGGEGIGTGSGVVISADGIIMTAGHVISKPGTELTVRFADGRVFKGIAIGLDHAADTGLAKITDPAPAGGWAFSKVAPNDSAAVGEWVLCTGNPGSIVVDRNPPLRIGRVTRHDDRTISTNCALEPGDSGGPVFDLKGRVVGINSRIMTVDTDVPLKEYLSMHVPVSLFTSEWKDLLAGEDANPLAVVGRSPGRGRMQNTQARRFRQAFNKLLAQRDPEALKLLADSQQDGGQMPLTPELMQHLIAKAAASTTQPFRPNQMAGAPTTAPAAAPRQIARADALPTAPPTPRTVASPQKGIAAELRPTVGAQLKRDLLRQFPNAAVNDDILNRIMDHSSIDPRTGRVNVVTTEQDLKDMGITPEAIAQRALPSNRTAVEVGKTSIQTLSLFAPSLQAAGDCVVEIRGGDNVPVLLGTIVSSDGYLVSKASDLPAHPIAVLPDGRMVTAHLVGTDHDTDLALLKVETDNLTAAHFSHQAPLGEWLSAPTADPNEPAVGVVSDIARPIPTQFAHFAGEQKLMLGIGFAGTGTILGEIMSGMPAEAAGLKAGDEVLELNGIAITDPAEFTEEIKKSKPGDIITVKVRRLGNEMEFKPVLSEPKATAQTLTGVGEADRFAGGKLSKRRTNFPMAIQTDTAIWANQCGGPLINLDGETIGVTIARYDRVCTFAIPAEVVENTVTKLKTGIVR